MNWFVFLGQFVNEENKLKTLLLLKTLGRKIYDFSNYLYCCNRKNIWGALSKIYSVMSDTTALNTGKKSGINKHFDVFYRNHHYRGAYSLKCLLHVNKIYFTHVIAKVKGKTKRPIAVQDGAMIMHFKDIQKPDLNKIIGREILKVSISKIAALHLIEKAESQMEQQRKSSSFRSHHKCLLALSYHKVMEVPEIMKKALRLRTRADISPQVS